MKFSDLNKGTEFTLEGQNYEVKLRGQRVAIVYVLDADYNRIEDLDEGDGFKKTVVTDVRFERALEDGSLGA